MSFMSRRIYGGTFSSTDSVNFGRPFLSTSTVNTDWSSLISTTYLSSNLISSSCAICFFLSLLCEQLFLDLFLHIGKIVQPLATVAPCRGRSHAFGNFSVCAIFSHFCLTFLGISVSGSR